MIRLAWRQMRLPASSTALLLGLLITTLILTRQSMTAFMHTSGLTDCLARNGSNCNQIIGQFTHRYAAWNDIVYALGFTPVLVGLFWGAPLIAREVEQGTHRLAWTQSISRSRWLTVRLGLYLICALALGALLTWLFTWWSGPLFHLEPDSYNNIQPQVFESRGIILAVNTCYAFALGTAAGAVIRRTVPAMGVAAAGYFADRTFFVLERSHLLPPHSITVPFGQFPSKTLDPAWVLDDNVIDSTGHRSNLQAIAAACQTTRQPSRGFTALAPCANAHGFRDVITYQPLSRFWPLQFAESGILIGLALLLLAVAYWWTLRRIS
ncbi:MAG TPA: LapA family protein [Rugosimonospora sp.]|nr:LapA family protein [Rugosimonospora sp.]